MPARSPASRRPAPIPQDRTPDEAPRGVRVPPAPVLTIDGDARPGSPEFQESLRSLYGVAFTIKFAARARGHDFPVRALEGLYWGLPTTGRGGRRRRWRLLVRVPGFVTSKTVREAVRRLEERGKAGPFDRVHRRRLVEGTCVQALHLGPYDAEGPTVERMAAWARSAGLRLRGPHHEIYLNDPRRVAAARLRTLLRYPVRRPAPRARAPRSRRP